MLLVYPISNFDLTLAKAIAGWIVDLGGVQDFPALLVVDPEIPPEEWRMVRAILEKAFKSVSAVYASLDPSVDKGWPAGPNAMFRAAAAAAPEIFPELPWYFFEPDNTPLASDWLKRIEAEYASADRPFVGVLQQSWRLLMPQNERIPAGQHLVGTGVYPSRLFQYTQAHIQSRDPMNGRVIAFDVAMQTDIVDGNFAKHTNLIQHNWLTCNYRREADGKIHCDPTKGRLAGQAGFSLPHVVNETIAVVHGCKDLSLLKLLLKERMAPQLTPIPLDTSAESFPVVEIIPPRKLKSKTKQRHGQKA